MNNQYIIYISQEEAADGRVWEQGGEVERVTSGTYGAMFESELRSLPLIRRGKVRDIYAVDEVHLLIIATDRLSAFDVVLPDAIPRKGEVLTALSNFWFERTAGIVPNHLSALRLEDVIPEAAERAAIDGQAVVVRRLEPLPVEAIVRGYLVGSGWKEYQTTGAVCGVELPTGLSEAERMPRPIFTPSTKARLGEHDENIPFERVVALVGRSMATQVRSLSLKLYQEAATYAAARGIIIADTKFEFGVDANGGLFLIDEVLTPDSSRFWPADRYQPGTCPPSFDKQFVRDYLESVGWDKRSPAPQLPSMVIEQTAKRYREARRQLMG